MEIITGTDQDLFRMICETKMQYIWASNDLEKCALYFRLDSLYRVLSAVSDDRKKHYYMSLSYKKDESRYNKILKNYVNEYLKSFIKNKEFHLDYLGDVLDVVTDELEVFLGSVESKKDTQFSSDDFYMIFYDFLKTMKLEYLFDDFRKNRKLFSKKRPYSPIGHDFEGLILHNPINGDMSIVSDKFNYQLRDMRIYAHEFGHVYDLGNLSNERLSETTLKFGYSSVYGEVISTMFEKLLFEFLISNNIMVEQTKDLFENSLFDNKDYIYSSYVLSLLDDKYLFDERYLNLKLPKLLRLVSDQFEDTSSLWEFLSYKDISLRRDVCYGYGDIMSLFLRDSIKNEGFDNKLMQDFMSCRTETFNPKFIENHNLDIKTYKKLYKQDVELCKK